MSVSETDRYAVFGNPIAQSKSPLIHKSFAQQTKQLLTYDKYCVDVDGFNKAADEFFANDGKGLNITAPFKLDAFNYAHKLTERAEVAGAVNTLALQADDEIIGDNTDGVGLVSDISQRLGWAIENKRVLILGAGGAVRGILLPMLNKKPQALTIANRTKSKAEELANDFSSFGDLNAHGYDDIEFLNISFDLIINCTSASISGAVPPLSQKNFADKCCVYDMVYGKEETAFLVFCRDCGIDQRADGLGMLVGQAAESFYIWRNVYPDVDSVLKQLREDI